MRKKPSRPFSYFVCLPDSVCSVLCIPPMNRFTSPRPKLVFTLTGGSWPFRRLGLPCVPSLLEWQNKNRYLLFVCFLNGQKYKIFVFEWKYWIIFYLWINYIQSTFTHQKALSTHVRRTTLHCCLHAWVSFFTMLFTMKTKIYWSFFCLHCFACKKILLTDIRRCEFSCPPRSRLLLYSHFDFDINIGYNYYYNQKSN